MMAPFEAFRLAGSGRAAVRAAASFLSSSMITFHPEIHKTIHQRSEATKQSRDHGAPRFIPLARHAAPPGVVSQFEIRRCKHENSVWQTETLPPPGLKVRG